MFDDISIFSPYEVLSNLNLDKTSVVSLNGILSHEYVNNGSLKKIVLPESINWLDIKNGVYINGEIVRTLRNQDVEVIVPNNFYYEDKKKQYGRIYLICGPSASGKSTLIENMRRDLGVKYIKKVSTRDYRSEDEHKVMDSISKAEYDEMNKHGLLDGTRQAHGYSYGVRSQDIMRVYLSEDVYLMDLNNIEDAWALKAKHPEIIRIVKIETDPSNVIKNFEKRIDILSNLKFESIEDEIKYRAGIHNNIKNNKMRKQKSSYKILELNAFKDSIDYSIDNSNFENGKRELKTILTQ